MIFWNVAWFCSLPIDSSESITQLFSVSVGHFDVCPLKRLHRLSEVRSSDVRHLANKEQHAKKVEELNKKLAEEEALRKKSLNTIKGCAEMLIHLLEHAP